MRRRKTVAFLPNHPAQIWLLRPVAEGVAEFADTAWFLRDKDVSVQLARAFGLPYTLLSTARKGMLGNAVELTLNTFRALWHTQRRNVDLWITKYGAGNVAAHLLHRKSLAFNDDDADVVPFIAHTSYPFADAVLATAVTRMGRYDRKTLRFPGCFELCYLHPTRFTPDRATLAAAELDQGTPYAIVRLSALQAHHDRGIRGVSERLIRRLIELTHGRMRIYISSEKPLAPEFEHLRFPIAPEHIHHALAFAEFFVGDSQTMTAEAAVLGTPAFRINDFVGRLSYIEQLERRGLAFGYKPDQEPRLLAELSAHLEDPDGPAKIARRRAAFLAESIDPVPWMVSQIRAYVA